MFALILTLAAPLLVSPLIVLAFRPLYAVFLQQGVMLFVGLPLPREWALRVAKGAAIFNAAIFACAWWLSIAMKMLELSALLVVTPFLAGLMFGLAYTSLHVRVRLALKPSDAWLVGLLTFTGGNLPMMVLFPTVLALFR